MSPHEKAIGVCTSATEVWFRYDPDLYSYLKVVKYYAHSDLNKQSKYTVCYRVVYVVALARAATWLNEVCFDTTASTTLAVAWLMMTTKAGMAEGP